LPEGNRREGSSRKEKKARTKSRKGERGVACGQKKGPNGTFTERTGR